VGARTIVVIVLSLVCGLAAVLGVNQLLNRGGTATDPDTVAVVVAALDMDRGTPVTESALEIKHVAAVLVPEGSFSTIEEALARTCLTDLLKGDTLTERKLSQPGSGQGMSALIPPGMRAFSIHTPTVGSGVAGFVMPGNKVDVLLTIIGRQAQDPTGGGSTTTLLQNVEVLAVDQKVSAPSDDATDTGETTRSVTLAVTPDQANKLSLAQKKGTLDLALRNATDVKAAKVRTVSLIDLRFQQDDPLKDDAEVDDTVPVVVAALDIGRGERISENVVRIRRWPEELVPEGALRSLDDAVGRIVASSLVRDEPLMDRKLVGGKGDRGGISTLIPKGMRAYTILTPTIASGVGGFALPGNRVDILLTVTETIRRDQGDDDEDYGGGTTTTLLQSIEILAVDQRLDAPAANKVDPEKLRSVTLLVTPNQAAKLSLSQKHGTLHLSLRAEGDTETAQTDLVTVRDLRIFQERAGRDVAPTELPRANRAEAWLRIRTIRGRQNNETRIYQPVSIAPTIAIAGADGKTE
jgi:pilus assembly protein CpaB